MTLTIPDEALAGVPLTPDQARVELAVGLFADGRVTLARGARIAGQTHLAFQKELARRHIALHYGVADFEQDLATLRTMDAQ